MKDYSNVGTDHQSSTSYQTKPTHNLNGDQKVKRISWTIAAALVAGLFLPVNAAQADPWKTIASTPLRSMTKDQNGNMYIGSTGSSIFKIDPSGEVANIGPTGNGARWVAVDSSGNIYNVNTIDGTVSKITPAGVIKNDFGATGVGSRPFKLAVDTAGNVFTLNVGNRTVSKITSAGVSTAAYLTFEEHAIPNTIATDQNDNLYVGICGDRIRTDLPEDQLDSPANLINEVRKITPSKVVTVLATTGQCPGDITIDPSGNIYTANYGAQFGWNVSKITPTGVSTILGTTGEYPVAIAIDPLGNIYTANDRSKDVSKITPAGDPTILGSTGNASPFGILYLSGNIYTSNIDGTVSKFPLTTTTSGSAPNSQVATISSGVTGVIIPSNAALPATTLKFGGAVPTAVTVVPVATNPAPASATPFTISGSTKIVDIQITGTFNGSATVCLDGTSTDHLFHYTGTPAAWVELPSRTYANGQVCGVTTSFSPFAAAPVPAAPVVVYVPPTPVPYLKTLSNPQIHLVGDKFVCTAGTYNSGYTLDGVIQGSATALYTPASYTFNLLFNQVAQNPLAVTAATNSATWRIGTAPAGVEVTCSVTVTGNSLTVTTRSSQQSAATYTALTTQTQSITAAENIYKDSVSANSKNYQKALVDNRAAWRANVEKTRAAYYAELNRINGVTATMRETSAMKSAALKTYLAAQKQVLADYKASGPAALVMRDLANKAALDTKTAAIVKANSVYGAFIESIGYGVLVP